jgi:hypothetical protein
MRGRLWKVRWGVVIVLGIIGVWLLYLAAFHSWASWGPPTPNPEWHRQWSYIFAVSALFAFMSSAIVLWTNIRAQR